MGLVRITRKWALRFTLPCAVVAGILVAPAQGITQTPPEVSIRDLLPTSGPGYTDERGRLHQLIVNRSPIEPFALVGLSWKGTSVTHHIFYVQVFQYGKWQSAIRLRVNDEHGPDISERVAQRVRGGTDPLIAPHSRGIKVWSISRRNALPLDFRVSLINSDVTSQDQVRAVNPRLGTDSPFPDTVTSPQGAVVKRPTFVTRAEWGADESWRTSEPKIASTLIAGFIHHTATKSDYTREEAPGQIRNLYAYFIKTRKYSDIAYNYIVDRFGTVYEGRSGCPLNQDSNCDGPSKPTIGGHTAGMNNQTFAIAVMGNFDTTPLDADTSNTLVTSVSQLVAWRIAPYGLNPNSMIRILSTDTTGLSRYKNGELSKPTPLISAHRDVGLTVCPGRYFYPLMQTVRDKSAEILRPVIRNFSVTPSLANAVLNQSVKVSGIIPAGANWSIAVQDDLTGLLVANVDGLQGTTGPIDYTWDLTDLDGIQVPSGRYSLTITASINDELIGVKSSGVVVSRPPSQVTGISVKKVKAAHYRIVWAPASSDYVPLRGYKLRVSANRGGVWGPWRLISNVSEYQAIGWSRKKSYWIQLVATNALGDSSPSTYRYWVP
mgnify:CR=1 FL=1